MHNTAQWRLVDGGVLVISRRPTLQFSAINPHKTANLLSLTDGAAVSYANT